MGRILPQGTELFALAPTEADPLKYEVIKVDCAISVDFGEDNRDDHEDTCLEERDDHTYIPGLNTPGETAVTVRVDPKNAGHVRLEQFSDRPDRLLWALGWSDGTAPATKAPSDAFDFVLPTTRTWNVFNGYIFKAQLRQLLKRPASCFTFAFVNVKEAIGRKARTAILMACELRVFERSAFCSDEDVALAYFWLFHGGSNV